MYTKEIIVVILTGSAVLLTPKTKNWLSPKKEELYERDKKIVKMKGHGLSLKEKREEIARVLFEKCPHIRAINFGAKGMGIFIEDSNWNSIQSFVHDEIHHEFGSCEFEIPRAKHFV
jgi:hypothetical protein